MSIETTPKTGSIQEEWVTTDIPTDPECEEIVISRAWSFQGVSQPGTYAWQCRKKATVKTGENTKIPQPPSQSNQSSSRLQSDRFTAK